MRKGFNIFITALKILLFSGVVFVSLYASCYLINQIPHDSRESINERFQIEIPKDWRAVYYNQGSLGGFAGEGTSYQVYQTTEGNEEFFSEFSQTKDAEFENRIQDVKESNFDNYSPSDPIELDYLYNIEQPYEWFYKYIDGATDADENSTRDAEIIMIYQSQKIYIFTTYRI